MTADRTGFRIVVKDGDQKRNIVRLKNYIVVHYKYQFGLCFLYTEIAGGVWASIVRIGYYAN